MCYVCDICESCLSDYYSTVKKFRSLLTFLSCTSSNNEYVCYYNTVQPCRNVLSYNANLQGAR